MYQPSSILFTWEFGDDLGHIARLRPVALELQRRGHQVVFAASNLKNVSVLPASITVIPAPGPITEPVRDRIREPATFADILYNAGIAHGEVLSGIVRAWRGIFDLVRPAVVVQDYSPYALLALQGYEARSLLLGTGFACPPDIHPLPDIRAWQNHYPERLQMTEQQVLEVLNAQLVSQCQPTLAGIGELFTRVDAGGKPEIWIMPVDGSEEPRALFDSGHSSRMTSSITPATDWSRLSNFSAWTKVRGKPSKRNFCPSAVATSKSRIMPTTTSSGTNCP